MIKSYRPEQCKRITAGVESSNVYKSQKLEIWFEKVILLLSNRRGGLWF